MTKNSSFISIAYFLVIVALLWILSFFPQCSFSATCQLVANMLLSCMIVYYTCPYVKRIFFSEKVSSANKAVLITGCDSVVGRNLARRLDSKGFRVFASCLFPSGDEAKALQKTCSNSLQILGFDVSKDESVKEALAYVKQYLNGSKLWAIVNIADMEKEKGFEWTRVQDFGEGMDIDAMGVVRVTKAFLPLLRRSRGRVVTVINLAARPSKWLSAHRMSTFATSCFCECLRKEMHPSGVKVVTIESDFFRAAITNWKLTEPKRDVVLENFDEESKEEYGENYVEACKELAKRALIHDSIQIDKVIECSENAVMLEEPWYVYRTRGDIFCTDVFYRFVLGILESLPKPFAYIFSHFVIYILGTTEPKKAE